MTDPVPTPAATNRRPFFLVLLLFFAPLLVAFALYYGSGWRPQGSTNKGDLIAPAIPLPEVSLNTLQGGRTEANFLRKAWTFVYVNEGQCQDNCVQALNSMRNVRQLLGKDMNRTAAALLVSGACCEQTLMNTYTDIALVRVDDAAGTNLMAVFPSQDGKPAMQAGRLYIVDPLGNLMMSYRAGADPRDLYQDMKKLLKLSHIG